MLNRSQAPTLSPLSAPKSIPFEHSLFSNGVNLYILNDPSQEVFRLDISFEAGAYYQPQPLIASTVINMLNEGTVGHTSAELAEIFDYYGAYIDFSNGLHKAEANLLGLNRYADPTIELIGEMISQSSFPVQELEIYLDNKRQHFLTEKEKTSWLARKKTAQLLFGTFHPYANVTHEEDYKKVDRDTLLRYYRERINAAHCNIILTGHITDSILKRTEAVFSQLPHPSQTVPTPAYTFEPSQPGHYHVYKAGSVQTSIRISQQGVELTNEDYAGFLLLNTVLGGYFGSRLMSNIRESKGYTYGINSFNLSLPLKSYWGITTDVNREYTEATIEEIQKEIKRLQTEKIPTEELSLVKNYLYGDLLRELDGVFAQSDCLKQKLLFHTDYDFQLHLIEKIQKYSASDLLAIANKYIDTERLFIVTAGEN
ncbi:M16 family metallopeptidase [Odoribacter lunatus]|uniref:M16 family metallopeptidase n=1 Tax=Odoribacter lunatus TaxID=2941335 RepID=UPI0020414DD5|nr:pitrilysin family protein [Odoribacter lunatus]